MLHTKLQCHNECGLGLIPELGDDHKSGPSPHSAIPSRSEFMFVADLNTSDVKYRILP